MRGARIAAALDRPRIWFNFESGRALDMIGEMAASPKDMYPSYFILLPRGNPCE